MSGDAAPDARRLTRRAVLGMLVAGAAACTRLPVIERVEPSPGPGGRRSGAAPGDPPAPAPGSATERDPARPDARPGTDAPAPYEPLAAEPLPNLKRVAGRFAEALLTYPAGAAASEVVAAALGRRRDGSRVADVARVAAPVFVPGAASTGSVVYPQFGGLQPLGGNAARASVMVVVEQVLTPDAGEPRRVTRTMDVRLAVDDGGTWRVRGLRSAGGTSVRRPRGLPSAAAEVLDDPRVELPDTARWDIHRGLIDERVLRLMTLAAQRRRISVAVLRTGHPRNVFGQDSVSSHTLGRAVDVWAVDGTPVVVQAREGTPTYGLVGRLLGQADVAQVGSPFDRDSPPPGSRSFTDLVHSDHIHIAIPQTG